MDSVEAARVQSVGWAQQTESPARLRSPASWFAPACHVLPIWIVLLRCTLTSVAQVLPSSIHDQYREETERFAQALAAVAQADNTGTAAEQIRSWQIPRAPDRQTLFLPPQLVREPLVPAPETTSHLFEAVQDHAQRLWQLALQALDQQQWQLAYRLAYEVAAAEPSHSAARRITGCGLVASSSAGPTLAMQRAPQRHPLLGWRAGRYWVANSDHFTIQSNDSAKAVRELAIALEVVHAAWRQAFVDFWATRDEIERLFRGNTPRSEPMRHRVVLFRSRDQFQRALRSREPLIGMTLGVYRPAEKTTYLFSQPHEADDQLATWRHEATHQLFQESHASHAQVAEHDHAWIVEGAGMYLESLQRFDRCCTLGGVDSPRLQHARYRCLTEGKHEPLQRLMPLGRAQLQSRADVRGLYSQAAGYTHLLMDGEAGSFRPAVVEYLRHVYANTATATTLQESLGRPLSELDANYREQFLPVRDSDLAAILVSRSVIKLSLGRCPITNQGLARLHSAPIDTLTWLDLNHCNVDDFGLDWLDQAVELQQLSLEQTRITDKTLRHLALMQKLEELDLSGTAISDEGLRDLAQLPHLRILWLSDTAATDRGMGWLESLQSLEQLDLKGTTVTDEAIARLRGRRPLLKITGR